MSEVDEELQLADEALNDLEHMEGVSLRRKYTTLYFGAYHAARAALISLEYAPKTHSGLDTLVHNILVNDKKLLDKDAAQTFSKLKTRREQADYETGFYGTLEEFESLQQKTQQLVDTLITIAEEHSSA